MKVQKSYYLDEGVSNKIVEKANEEKRSESQTLQMILEEYFKNDKNNR